MKIKEVEISGFKGIHNLVIHPKQINILVGKNNTGKTSILEAINSTLGISMFRTQMKYEPHLSSLIKVNSKESKIVVKLKDENKYLLLTRPEINEILPEFKKNLINKIKEMPHRDNKNKWEKVEEMIDKILIKDDLLSEIEKESIKIETSGKQSYIFSYTSLILKEIEPVIDYIIKEIFQEKYTRGFIQSILLQTIRFSHSSRTEKEEKTISFIDNLALSGRFGILSNKSKINEIEKYLKNRNILKNLERFDFDKLLFKDDNGDEYEIPYSFMGDGFKSLIGLIGQTSPENKIVLLEEPENHMHPAYIREIIRNIIDFSIANNTQFFITTHNSDILDIITTDMLEPGYQKYLSKELNVIKLDRLGEDIVAQELSRKDAATELEYLKLDLRGQ